MNTMTKSEQKNIQTAQPQTERAGAERPCVSPAVDIYETKDAYFLEAEMPGVSKDGLEVLLEGSDLTIVGRRKQEKFQGDTLYRESRAPDYQRVFELDPTVDTARISAAMEQGVLILTLPKAENLKPRRITISD